MALKSRSRGVWWSRFHFLVRFAGLTGVLAMVVGAALLFRYDLLNDALLKNWQWLLVDSERARELRESFRSR